MNMEDHLWLCFFRGLNVFGRETILMFELERKCRTTLAASGLPIRFVVYFKATGNIAVLGTGVAVEDIRSALFRVVPKPAALVQPTIVPEIAKVFGAWPPPPDNPGFRWTPGVSFLCKGDPADTELVAPDLGVFKRIATGTVALYRKERVTERGTLHEDRNGGWTAVSNLTGTVLGGVWTARSFNIITSLLEKAHRKLRSTDQVT
jgi:hypothetical protein